MDTPQETTSRKISNGEVTEILHMLKNIAQKDIVIIHNLEAVLQTLKSKRHDHDQIWEIVKGGQDERKVTNAGLD